MSFPTKVMLVYQGGIANVFAVDSFNMKDFEREAKRLLQADFQTCITFARGMGAAGCVVRTAACNTCGDITHTHWTERLAYQPFANKLVNVKIN